MCIIIIITIMYRSLQEFLGFAPTIPVTTFFVEKIHFCSNQDYLNLSLLYFHNGQNKLFWDKYLWELSFADVKYRPTSYDTLYNPGYFALLLSEAPFLK